MSKRVKRQVCVLLTLSLLVALLAPFAAPAGARSHNGITKIARVTSDWASTCGTASTQGTGALSMLILMEDSDFKSDFKAGDRLRITLRTGVKWVSEFYNGASELSDVTDIHYWPYLNDDRSVANGENLSWSIKSDTIMEITITGGVDPSIVDTITIPLYVDINGTVSDIYVLVENIDSGITGGYYSIAISNGDDEHPLPGGSPGGGSSGGGVVVQPLTGFTKMSNSPDKTYIPGGKARFTISFTLPSDVTGYEALRIVDLYDPATLSNPSVISLTIGGKAVALP